MIAENDKQRARLLGAYLLLVAAAICEMNVPGFFWEPFSLGVRITIPVLLVVGWVGTLRGIGLLRAVGWVGIVAFTLLVVCIVFLSDDYIAEGTPDGPPNVPHAGAFAWRIVIFLASSVALIVCFKRLARLSPASTTSGAGAA